MVLLDAAKTQSEIISMTSNSQKKTIVTTAFANDFMKGWTC